MSVANDFHSQPKLNQDTLVCAMCGHPQSDHPMNDVCWHDIVADGKVKLCSCPGFKAALEARSASSNPQTNTDQH